MSKINELTYCGKLVKEQDPDRFLISLFMPADKRADLWALFALNYEIAKTREVVTDTTLGLIRLQWWKDAIKSICEGREPPQNEILPDLASAIQTYHLPYEAFEKLITAREFDLETLGARFGRQLEIPHAADHGERWDVDHLG